ncbi:MAG: DUF4349 domain-containing protein [Actinomycetota bacterium]|nr:DUF4349 domain-containing protein [Actinomycetota bacterium]
MATPVTRFRAIHSTRIRIIIGLALGLVAITGCSGNRLEDRGTSGAAAPGYGESPDQDVSAPDEAVGGGGGDLPENAPTGGALTEQIVRTGDLSVEVDDVTAAANRITAVVDAAGGNIGLDQRYGEDEDGSADLVVRIAPERFDDLLETISDLGEELSRSVSAQDVSTAVADVDARVESLRNSVDRLLALAAQAVSVSDLITIEAELSTRQAELESLQAQQRELSDQVSLATLSVALTASSDADTDDTGFLASLGDGWNALLDSGRGLISLLGLLLPWLALLAVLALPLWFVVRRRRSHAAAAATYGRMPGREGSVPETVGEAVSETAASAPGRQPE